MLIHVVQAGETIYSIATQYGVNPARLMSDNGVGEDGALAVGQALVVLFPRVIHAVTEGDTLSSIARAYGGDTLSSIARAYGISLRQLYRNNYFLGGRDAVYPGNALVISYVSRPIGSIVTNGYAYPHIRRPTLQASLPYMTCLTPFTYGITAAGACCPSRMACCSPTRRQSAPRR